MLRWLPRLRFRARAAVPTILLAVLMSVVPFQEAFALITGGEGNKPVNDPGWPKGAAAIFNNTARIAWWEGPPFGGGQWHAECRGDAKALNAVLADFAKLDVKSKRVVVHDGVGHSFWLNLNREPAKEAAARMDWSFTVWQPASWERLRKMPADLNPIGPSDAEQGPPSEIDVYDGGSFHWSDITVPQGLDVVDERLVGHGFTVADGIVIEGKVIDLATNQPLAARMRLERVEPQPKGGYHYIAAAQAEADATGRWVLKHAPVGWHRVVVEADGYVPRVAGYAQFDEQPRWASYNSGLSRPGPVSGHVMDDANQPIADVDVRLDNVAPEVGGRYESPQEYKAKTDAGGHFRLDLVPIGHASVWVHKPGYCRPGLGPAITVPANDVALKMTKSGRIQVTIDFTGKERPEGYIVNLTPEGGNVVGSWGGSGQINAQNQMAFEDVPPGRYTLEGKPNPSNGKDQTETVTVDLKGGQVAEITLKAR